MSASTCTAICARSRGLPVAAERSVLQRFERAGALTWLLAAVSAWAALLWLAALAGMGSHLRATPVLVADPLPPPTVEQPARIGPLAQYAEAASRPLFTEDRRPRNFIATNPEGDGDGAAQAQTLDFILTGVLISPQVELAVLQPNGGGESQRVRVGKSPEGAAGWQLLRLEPRRAIFQGNGGEVALDLRTFGEAGSPAPPPGSQTSVVAPVVAANAAASAAADAASATAPQADAARIEAIRQRIEARRAQQRASGQSSGAPTPPKP